MFGWLRRRSGSQGAKTVRKVADEGKDPRPVDSPTPTASPRALPNAVPEPPDRPLPPIDQEVGPFVQERLEELTALAMNPLDRRILVQLHEVIGQGTLEIPMVPDVAGRLLSLDSDSELSNLEVAGMIGRDQELSARVLQVANSPATGVGHVQDLDQCVSLLGFEMVRGIAVGVAMSEAVFRVPGYETETRALRFHSEQVAAQAAVLARASKEASPGELYMAGLFHDVGQLVVYLNLSRMRAHTRGGRPTSLLVKKLVEELHPVLGLSFAEARGLPEALRWSIGYHHAPGLAPGKHQTAVALVALADVLDEDAEALPAFEDESHPLLLDPSFWPEDLPEIAGLLEAWKATA